MTMEESRRSRLGTQPLPLTWEVPTAIGLLALLLVIMTPLVVQAGVSVTTTGGAVWPSKTLTGLAGIAEGRFGQGLPPEIAQRLPSSPVMWILTAIAEAMVLSTLGVLGARAREIVSAGARRGLASRAVAAQALGTKQLRREAAVIRPDLTSSKWRRGTRR